MDLMTESELQNLIYNNADLRKDICNALDIDFLESRFEREVTFVNGITADFTLFQNDKIRAIFECKSGKINVTDYVRGIGQIFQYEFFAEEKLTIRDYTFYPIDDFYSVLIFPDSVLRPNNFNIGLFKYPKSKKIIEINTNSWAVRLVDDKELNILKNTREKNIIVVSQYYIRDNRLFELYFLLKVLSVFKLKNKLVHRETLHKDDGLLRQTKTINNGNWRNAFISLASLGFIDKNNYPTQAGFEYANKPFYEFAYMLFKSYLQPYYKIIFDILPSNINISNYELCDKIREMYKCKTDILFLTESSGRYISSWLNIARDDFGIIDFKPKQKYRKILCNPFEINEKSFKAHIDNHSKYNNFKKDFERILDEI